MSVSAVAGVFLKLSWLVLKICKWVLVNMSMNCKFSGFSGRVPAAFKLKKPKKNSNGANFAWTWKKLLLSLCVVGVIVGSLMFSLRLKAGVWKGKGETPKLFQGKSGFYLKHFNVSMGKFLALVSLLSESDQIASLEHAKKLFEKAPRNDIACSLKVKCVEEELDYHGGWFAENGKHMDRCTLRQLELFLPGEKSKDQDNIDENVMQARAVKDNGEAHCERCSFCFVNICCWVLLGVIATYKFSLFLLSSWRKQNEKPIQEQPTLPQQPKKLTQQKKQEQAKFPSTGNWRKNLLALFVSLGLMASVGIFFYISANIVLRRKETLINMCDQRARMLQDQFNVSMNHVNSLALLVSTFHHGKNPSAIDQQTFREYTERTAFERPLTSGVAYALKVSHSEREHFEKQHGWTIKKMENEDQTLVQDCNTENLDPSPVRDEYAPVIFSQETVSHIVSIDMMSGREDRENILRARASGKGVLTSPFKLLKSNHLGVVLTFAVYRPDLCPDATPEQRIQATVGYLGASYDVPSLVEKLLHQLASKQAIVVNVYDTTNASAPINMYGTEVVVDTGLSHTNHIDFGDPSRKHEMICRFKEKPPLPWVAILASVAIAIITSLLGHIFLVAINRIAKVELDFQKMMELKVRAEAADVAKSQFLATVSHEIRTPMNGVLGMLQMLMDTDLDANQLDFAQTAHDSGKDLISLINEVLDQAKIESGRLELEAVPFDLRDVLDHVLSLFSGRYHEKGIEMAVYVSEQVPEVVIGDPGRFRQIIANLVGNSIKFTQNKGHIFVSVHLAAEAGDQLHPKDEVMKQGLISVQDRSKNTNDTLSGLPVVDRRKSLKDFKILNETDFPEEPKTIKLLVTVEDTGIGICHDAQCRIFTPFMQADSSTSRKYGGTGIGLSISKRLVGLMCGEIGFVSEPGIGSTFSFTVVLRKGERSSLDTKRQAFDPAISEFWGWRTLVVDERRVRAEVTKYHLKRLGIHVDTVSSLKSACSYLSSTCNTSSSQLAVIAVDEEAWERDTDQAFQHLIQQLRRNGSTRAPNMLPKIFLLTNCPSPSKHIEISSTSVVDDVLLKPLRLSVLIACFQGVLGIGKKRQLSRCKTNLKNLLKEKRILVVDDNLVNKKVAAGALKKHGAIVTCVSSGRDALRKLKPPHNFDACFMDLQMPEMDGFQATKSIRSMENEINAKIESNPGSIEMSTKMVPCHTPILAMTADVIQATNEKCMMYGMDGYVSKPFEEDQLYSAVARFFESTS